MCSSDLSLAALANAGLLAWSLRTRLGGLEDGRLASSLGRIAVASACMGAAAWSIQHGLDARWPGTSSASQAVHLGASIGGAVVVLAASAYLLRIREFSDAMQAIGVRRSR